MFCSLKERRKLGRRQKMILRMRRRRRIRKIRKRRRIRKNRMISI